MNFKARPELNINGNRAGKRGINGLETICWQPKKIKKSDKIKIVILPILINILI